MNRDNLSRSPLRRRAWLRIVIVCAVAYILVCTALILRKGTAPAGRKQRPEWTRTHVGQIVPQFRVITTGGHVFDSAASRNTPVLVTFFATWCGPCERELARLEPEVWQRERGRGLTVLAISIDDGDTAIKRFWSRKGLTFPAASDAGRKVFSQFAATAIPRTYLIDAQGRIVYQSFGYTDEEFPRLVHAVDAALARVPEATLSPRGAQSR